MMIHAGRQPAIALVDDDYHSARLMTRMLEAHGGPQVIRLPAPDVALEALAADSVTPMIAGRSMAIVDLKASSTATCVTNCSMPAHLPCSSATPTSRSTVARRRAS